MATRRNFSKITITNEEFISDLHAARAAISLRKVNGKKFRNHCYALFNHALKQGVLVRPENCEECGGGEGKIYGHHPDYYRPIEVEWLCAKCHGEAHLGEYRETA